MSEGDSSYRTGQPVWVLMQDGSRRRAEYLGEATEPENQGMALVVYVDAPDHGVVNVDQLQLRETDPQDPPARSRR
jgi:hypothetical protein